MRFPARDAAPRDDAPRPLRTYVVLGLPRADWAGGAVTVLGTVRAPNRAAAGQLARALARRRGPLTPSLWETDGWAVRWRAAGACRRGWLVEALARDGAVLLAGGGR